MYHTKIRRIKLYSPKQTINSRHLEVLLYHKYNSVVATGCELPAATLYVVFLVASGRRPPVLWWQCVVN